MVSTQAVRDVCRQSARTGNSGPRGAAPNSAANDDHIFVDTLRRIVRTDTSPAPHSLIEPPAESGRNPCRPLSVLVLVALAATLRQAAPVPAASTTSIQCTIVTDGTIVLDDQPCAFVGQGGAVTVSQGDVSRAFTLDAAYDWLVLDGSDPAGAAVTFEALPANGSITLALADGAERERTVPPEVPEMGGVFDALSPTPVDPGE